MQHLQECLILIYSAKTSFLADTNVVEIEENLASSTTPEGTVVLFPTIPESDAEAMKSDDISKGHLGERREIEHFHGQKQSVDCYDELFYFFKDEYRIAIRVVFSVHNLSMIPICFLYGLFEFSRLAVGNAEQNQGIAIGLSMLVLWMYLAVVLRPCLDV